MRIPNIPHSLTLFGRFPLREGETRALATDEAKRSICRPATKGDVRPEKTMEKPAHRVGKEHRTECRQALCMDVDADRRKNDVRVAPAGAASAFAGGPKIVAKRILRGDVRHMELGLRR